MKDKKTAIAVGIAIIVVLAIFGGANFIGNLFSGSNNQQTQTVTNNQPQIQSQDTTVGTGTVATIGKTVTVNYIGVFTNGQKFDSSYDRNQPFSFVVGQGQVIKGWDLGIIGMKVGGKRILVVPPEYGYGSQAYGPIPANSTLIFQVELLDVK